MTDEADPFASLRTAAAGDGEHTRVLSGGPAASKPSTTASIAAPGGTAAPGVWAAGSTSNGDSLLRPGTLLNNTQRIEALIGRGGMGEVYRATNIHTGDQDAIKVIRPDLASDPQVRELFRREAGALRKVRHPSVVSYEGVFGDDSGRLFLVMDYVDGPSLASLIARGPLAPADVRRVGAQVAQGLSAAHSRGVVHRDLSPDNIVLRDGSLDHAVLIDFGVAKRLDAGSTLIGSGFAGKLDYCSPEQCGLYDASVDHRSDIYSLGLVLAAAAVGRPLPMGSSLARAVKARESTPDLSNVPEDLRRDLTRLLEPDPLRRMQSMHEVAALFSYGAAPSPAPPRKSTGLLWRLAWGAGGVGVVLVLLGAGALVGPRLIALTSGPPRAVDKPVDRTELPPAEQRQVADAPAKADDVQRDAEAKRLADEEARRQEAERVAADQAAADKRAAEEAQRRADEESRRQAADQQRAEDERRRADEAQRKADDERRAAEAQRKADDERAAEAQRKADDERRAAEAQRKADDERRAAEAQRKADDERRQREAAQHPPTPAAPPAPQPPRQPQQAARQAPPVPPVGVDGTWRGRICYRRIALTAGNETCGPLSLSIVGGNANGSWVVNTVTYGIVGTITGGGGRLTLDIPPVGRGASLGAKFTLPIRFDGNSLQGQGYTITDVLIQFSAGR